MCFKLIEAALLEKHSPISPFCPNVPKIIDLSNICGSKDIPWSGMLAAQSNVRAHKWRSSYS